MPHPGETLRTARLLAVALFVAAPLAHPAMAGINRWTAFGPGAGTIQTLLSDPAGAGILYVLTWPTYSDYAAGEIYKSFDEGSSWRWSGTGLPLLQRAVPQALALDPARPGTLYTARGAKVFRSTDGAAHWEAAGATGLPDGVYESCHLAVAAGNPGSVFFAYGPHLVRSTDGGITWIPMLEASREIRVLFVRPTAPHDLYVGIAGHGGNLISTDGGTTFKAMRGLGEATGFAAPISGPPGLLYAASAGKIYSCDDGGLHWHRRGGIGLPVHALAVDSGSAGAIYAAHDHGMSISRDGGETWRRVKSGFPHEYSAAQDGLFFPERILSLAVNPARPEIVYAGAEYSGVYKSTDAGRRWTSGSQRGLLSETASILLIHPKVPATLYLTRPDSVDVLWRSTDGGQTWIRKSDFSRGFNILQLAVNPVDPDVVYAVSVNLHRSRDGGATWRELLTGSPITSVVATGERTLVALAYSSSIIHSSDGGTTWKAALQLTADPTRYYYYNALKGDPGNPKIVYLLASEAEGDSRTEVVFRSKDGGATWSRFLTGTSIVVSAPNRPGTIYTVVDKNLLRTINDGRSWEVVGPIPEAAWDFTLAVDPQDPMALMAGTLDLGVLYSSDGGKDWKQINAGLARLGRNFVDGVIADPSAPHTWYALPLGGGIFSLTLPD